MKRSSFIAATAVLTSCPVTVASLAGSAQAESSSGLDAAITSEFQAAKHDVPNAKLLIKDGGTNLAYGDGTVAISRAFLRTYVSQASAVQFKYMLRFLIAHELVHVLQFSLYGGEASVLGGSDHDTRVAYEAQADILAANYLFGSFDGPNRPATEAIINALQLGFNIGEENGDHPLPPRRRNGIRMGLASGSYLVALALSSRDERFAQSAAVLRSSLDFAGNDLNAWSLKTGRRINHWHASDVELSTKDRTIDTSDPQWFNYRIALLNSARTEARLDTEVQSISYPRSEPHDGAGSELWGTKHQYIFIPAGEQRVLSGSLPRVDNASFAAELVFPPDPRALFCAIS